jgi:hypothetical protein
MGHFMVHKMDHQIIKHQKSPAVASPRASNGGVSTDNMMFFLESSQQFSGNNTPPKFDHGTGTPTETYPDSYPVVKSVLETRSSGLHLGGGYFLNPKWSL